MADANKTSPAMPENTPQGQDFKSRIWDPILRPIVALTAITLVTSFLLGITNNITKPYIEQNNRIITENAQRELLPKADSFENVTLEQEYSYITSMVRAANGAGYIIEAYAPGYGGAVPVLVAFGEDGNIAGVKFLANNETPGLGKKINTEPWFSEQYLGLPPVPFDAASAGIDQIASATISSNAANNAINTAILLYAEIVQGEILDGIASASEKDADYNQEGDQPKEEKNNG